MARAIITATEAKSAALLDLDIRSSYKPLRFKATGTGTDNILVVSGAGPSVDSSGGHTKMGELIAKAVYQGVREAISRQNGINMDRSVFHRLKERRIDIFSLSSACSRENGLKTFWPGVQSMLLNKSHAAFLEAAFAVSDRMEAQGPGSTISALLPVSGAGLNCKALNSLPPAISSAIGNIFQEASGAEARPHVLTLLVIDPDVKAVLDTLKEMPALKTCRIRFFSSSDVRERPGVVKEALSASDVILVDVMGKDLSEFVSKNVKARQKPVYALRSSTNDEALKEQGFIFDSSISNYFSEFSQENIRNMLLFVVNRHFDPSISFKKVCPIVKQGIFHPDADHLFSTMDTYITWLKKRSAFGSKRPVVGLTFFSSFLTKGHKEPLSELIRRLEVSGFTVIPCFGRDKTVFKDFFLRAETLGIKPDMVVSFSLKFYSSLDSEIASLIRKLNVPVINAVSLYEQTTKQWRESRLGLSPMETSWSMATPEISGLVEPTVLIGKKKVTDKTTGKHYFVYELIEENLHHLLSRMKALYRLETTPNSQKRVAIMFYNHHQGKQNVGASYLNVFESLKIILSALKGQGYKTGPVPSRDEIRHMILSQARNVGSWAPGELERMMTKGRLLRVNMKEYKNWFSSLPASFRKKVIEQWGEPEKSKIMVKDGYFVIPAVRCGNFLLLPEPARGWGDDPLKLYHSPTLYPHHQYLAVYLWLNKVFDAHAVVHLGTHATYEWTPGKQAGLDPACSPEVLSGHIPNIYPYVVDDVGEAIQAKRRGRGVMVSHLTPMFKRAGLYRQYAELNDLINSVEIVKSKGGKTAKAKIERVKEIAMETGILKDIGLEAKELCTENLEVLSSYLEEIRQDLMPYGLHAFGRAPAKDGAREMAQLIAEENRLPKEASRQIQGKIAASARLELKSLFQGLSGHYVFPGEGNDPVRNPASLPTGRNLYGFNPQRIPSKQAWQLGKKAADQIIFNYSEKHGRIPQKVAMVLWATETQRNEGVNECSILWLIGVRPVWSPSGRVTGMEVIPGDRLGRPRIDVVINASGLYRDLFPDRLDFLDRAIQLAALQDDVENLIAVNTKRLKMQLSQEGMDLKEAGELASLRIFSEEPGSYGTGVAEMAANSGTWEKDAEIAQVFENRMGFAYGRGQWGRRALLLLKGNLKQVETVVHSRSSNLYSTMDNDDVFQYLGGLSLSVKRESGSAPETLITLQSMPGKVNVEDAAKTIGRELRARYLNPKWIKAMEKEGYAGAREISNFVEYMWGWQVTTPDKIDGAKWMQTFKIYVADKYHLSIKEFFNRVNPWAYQSVTARMLEAVRKGYWKPGKDVVKRLAAEYALNVVEKGVACCDHTCNNPFLNQMVVSIISVPGLVSPEVVEKFKAALRRATGKDMMKLASERRALQKRLTAPGERRQLREMTKKDFGKEVKGYVMKEEKNKEQETPSSSGVQWAAILFVAFLLALFGAGIFTRRRL